MFGKKEKQPFYKEKEFWLGLLAIGTGVGILFFMGSDDDSKHKDKGKSDWKKRFNRAKKAFALKLLLD